MNLTVEEFIIKNRGIILNLARKYTNSDLGIEFDDLFQVGCMGLLDCYCKYDPTKSSVSNYAYENAKHYMLNYINKNITIFHISRRILSDSYRFSKEDLKFYEVNGRYMNNDEAIEWIKNNLDEKIYINAKKYLSRIKYVNYYYFILRCYSVKNEKERLEYCDEDNIGKSNVEKNVVSSSNVEQEAISNVIIENFIKSLYYLSKREKECFLELMGLVDGVPKTNMQLAEELSITKQCVNINYQRALKKIKERNSKKNLI